MSDVQVILPPYSVLAKTPIYNVDGVVVPGLMQQAIVPSPTDVLYTVTLAGERRLDLISQLFYGTPHLWWVIMLANNMKDPLVGIRYGTQIRVPTKSRLAEDGVLSA